MEFPLAILRILFIWLASQCAMAGVEDTVYPYQIDESILADKDFKTFIIASHNLGKPTRQHLRGAEEKIDKYVVKYLKKHGYKVLDDRIYAQALSAAEATYGDPYDPTTGKLDMQKKQQVLSAVFGQLKESQPALDGVVFTDLIAREVYFSSGQKRVARWDGVSRAPLIQGAGSGVSLDFNWAQPVDAASLAIYIFTIEGKNVFSSIGGMSLTDALDTRGTAKFVRARNVLSNKDQINEGIELALHPLVPMKNYPGK
jgi:hypothetical protein